MQENECHPAVYLSTVLQKVVAGLFSDGHRVKHEIYLLICYLLCISGPLHMALHSSSHLQPLLGSISDVMLQQL